MYRLMRDELITLAWRLGMELRRVRYIDNIGAPLPILEYACVDRTAFYKVYHQPSTMLVSNAT